MITGWDLVGLAGGPGPGFSQLCMTVSMISALLGGRVVPVYRVGPAGAQASILTDLHDSMDDFNAPRGAGGG